MRPLRWCGIMAMSMLMNVWLERRATKGTKQKDRKRKRDQMRRQYAPGTSPFDTIIPSSEKHQRKSYNRNCNPQPNCPPKIHLRYGRPGTNRHHGRSGSPGRRRGRRRTSHRSSRPVPRRRRPRPGPGPGTRHRNHQKRHRKRNPIRAVGTTSSARSHRRRHRHAHRRGLHPVAAAAAVLVATRHQNRGTVLGGRQARRVGRADGGVGHRRHERRCGRGMGFRIAERRGIGGYFVCEAGVDRQEVG